MNSRCFGAIRKNSPGIVEGLKCLERIGHLSSLRLEAGATVESPLVSPNPEPESLLTESKSAALSQLFNPSACPAIFHHCDKLIFVQNKSLSGGLDGSCRDSLVSHNQTNDSDAIDDHVSHISPRGTSHFVVTIRDFSKALSTDFELIEHYEIPGLNGIDACHYNSNVASLLGHEKICAAWKICAVSLKCVGTDSNSLL
jgi:hypothetical protein